MRKVLCIEDHTTNRGFQIGEVFRGQVYTVKRAHVDMGRKYYRLDDNLCWFPEKCFIKLNFKYKLFRLL